MPSADQFSLGTAGLILLGAIAASALAIAVAASHSGGATGNAAAVRGGGSGLQAGQTSPSAPPTNSALPNTEVEYLLETGGATPTTEQR